MMFRVMFFLTLKHRLGNYTQSGRKLRFFRSGNAQFVTVGII